MRLRHLLLGLSTLANPPLAAAETCDPIDYLAKALPAGDAVEVALKQAYPGLKIDRATGSLRDAPWHKHAVRSASGTLPRPSGC